MGAPQLQYAIPAGGGVPVGVAGAGTVNRLTKWTAATTIADSSVFESGGAIATLTLTAGGTGYTNGTYSQQALTGGTGTGATADIVVAVGIVTAISLRSPGTGYAAADALSCATIGAGAGFVATAATIAQVVAASGDLTALGRIGAGTATPRAALDVVGGMVANGSTEITYYNGSVNNPVYGNASVQIGLVGAPAIAPLSNRRYTGLLINPLIDTSGATTAGPRGVFANPIMVTSPAAYTGTTVVFDGSALRREPGDLATASNLTVINSAAGVFAGLVSTSTNAARTLNAFITSGIIGHTITTCTHLDLNWSATGNITTATGLNCNPISGITGTVTTFYGVRIQASIAPTAPTITNRWGISQEDTLAKNYFAGNVGIGTASPVSALDVSGTITCDDAATGIKLPATPGNADVRTLDAYNENTAWAPSVTWGTGGTVTTTSATGAFTQIGNVVTFTVTIAYNSAVVPTGGAITIDLPRTSAAGFNQRPGTWAFNSFNGTTGTNFLSIGGASTTATLRVATATGTVDIAANLTVTASGALVVTATYLAS